MGRGFVRTADADGRRAVHGASDRFQTDPNWRDHVLFYEYFNGDTGAGLGASHQTGWTGIVAKLIRQCARYCEHDGSPMPTTVGFSSYTEG